MTSLEEKQKISPAPPSQKRYILLYLVLTVLLTAGIAFGLWLRGGWHNTPDGTLPSSDRLAVPTVDSTTSSDSTTEPSNETQPQGQSQTDSPITVPDWPQITLPGATTPTGSDVPTVTIPTVTFPQPTQPYPTQPAATQPAATQPSATQPPETTEATTEPTETEAVSTTPVAPDYGNGIPGTEGYRTQLSIDNPGPAGDEAWAFIPVGETAEFFYIKTTAYSAYNPDNENPGDEYEVAFPANLTRNGIYTIPAYFKGGKVVAVGSGSMGDGVSITLPETIRYICADAFYHYKDSELAYVYIKSDMLDIHESAFPDEDVRRYTIVLRTSAQCKNSNGEYYKDIAGRYGCVWEEWNG